jgi:hypothetical protein
MKLYIAGRIAGEYGYLEKFSNAALEVLGMGHEPVDPCELHADCAKQHLAWEDWMVCDIKAMLDCDGVYALRDWRGSKGATVEVQLALRLNKQVIYQ